MMVISLLYLKKRDRTWVDFNEITNLDLHSIELWYTKDIKEKVCISIHKLNNYTTSHTKITYQADGYNIGRDYLRRWITYLLLDPKSWKQPPCIGTVPRIKAVTDDTQNIWLI